jgi:DNA-binding HxlR family transcriptional regulator
MAVSTTTDTDHLDWRSVCSITSGLDVLGDKWSLLIVRDLIAHGTRTYSEFRESPEHVATNILAARLRLLTSLGIIERTNPDGTARNNAYRLTPSGAALRPVIEELGRWAQTYLKPYHADMVNSI